MLCAFCLKNDFLCSACNDKLARGELSDVTVAASRLLHKLDVQDYAARMVDTGMLFIVAKKGTASKVVGRGGRNVKQLEDALRKKVRIVEAGEKQQLTQGVLGVPVVGINIVYGPAERYRVRVSRVYQRRVDHQAIRALDALLGRQVEVVFE